MVYYQIHYKIQNLFAECTNFCLRLLVCFKSVLMYVKASGIFFLLLILFSKSFFSRSNQPCPFALSKLSSLYFFLKSLYFIIAQLFWFSSTVEDIVFTFNVSPIWYLFWPSYAWNIFATLLHEMVPGDPLKETIN